MGLTIEGLMNDLRENIPKNRNMDAKRMLEIILDRNFQQGEVEYESVDITPPAGSLKLHLTENSLKYDNTTWHYTPESIGKDIADYWVKAIGLGTNVMCDRHVKEVINDAAKIAAPIASELTALAKSQANVGNFFYKFSEIIVRNVKTTIWTETELCADGSDKTYTCKLK